MLLPPLTDLGALLGIDLVLCAVCLRLLSGGVGDISNSGIEHTSGCVNDCNLAACSVSGIKPERNLALDGRLEQKLL